MSVDFIAMFESLAEHGTAPDEGCSLFGVGYEDAFQKLETRYIRDRFSRGGSAEKFVVGPFGSGKTHFLRQLMEVGRRHDCVTAEVKLNKNLDFTHGLVVYQEIVRQLRSPGETNHGLRALLLEAIERIRARATAEELPADGIVAAWIAGLTEQDFALPGFGRVLRKTLVDHQDGNIEGFEYGVRWLSGEVTDRALARAVGESPVSSAEIRIHAHNAKLSLYRLVKYAGFHGTIVGFDEAEQGIATEKKKMMKIFSHLLAEINAVVDSKDSSVMILYAVTPDVVDKINRDMPMLAQRLSSPPDAGFFDGDGNVLAPQIDLTRRPKPVDELTAIGKKLVELFFETVSDADRSRQPDALAGLSLVAEEVEREEGSSSARRLMVKRVCTALVNSYRVGFGLRTQAAVPAREAEV